MRRLQIRTGRIPIPSRRQRRFCQLLKAVSEPRFIIVAFKLADAFRSIVATGMLRHRRHAQQGLRFSSYNGRRALKPGLGLADDVFIDFDNWTFASHRC
jgi:hypothetical protein